ncbi:NEAT domain-containing protein [Kurthia senegalensis]|nr:NEAT domain-containing protein [Kurthia senegalensis]
MMKKLGLLLVAFMLVFTLIPGKESQAKLKDGTYKVNYTVMNAQGNSVSYGNDYFVKPATVVVKNGKMTAKITIKRSNWIKKFTVSTGGNKIVSKNKKKNTRVVQFKLKTLSSKSPTKVSTRVEIPSKKILSLVYNETEIWQSEKGEIS